MVKTTKKQTNKKMANKPCCCKCFSFFKGNLFLNIFFIAVYTFVILLFLTMWSKLHNKKIMKEQKCLIHKLYCCGYDNKTECDKWHKYCKEDINEKLNCNLGK